MDLSYAISRLEHQGAAIDQLVAGVGEAQARWRPAADDWSILEVISHLADEEREDFRQRVDFTLHRLGESWPSIDPAGWVCARRYNERDLAVSRADFATERARSLAWLGGLTTPNWSRAYHHPSGRIITAGDLLMSWVAHDLLHLRQLVELHYSYLAVAAPGRDVGYAGEW